MLREDAIAGIRISLDISRVDPAEARVRLYGGDLGCYFAYARNTITVYPHEPLSPVPLFKGARARGNLFIENERAGTLYLRFHFRRDDIDKSKGTGPPTWQLSNEDLYRRQIPGSLR
jgi:hypothetical protein